MTPFRARRLTTTLLAACLLAVPTLGKAATDAAAEGYTEAVVRKVDAEGGRLTLKHAEIRSMDMPPMTMVFELRDKALLAGLKPGDKLRFKAVKEGGRLIVTELQPLK